MNLFSALQGSPVAQKGKYFIGSKKIINNENIVAVNIRFLTLGFRNLEFIML